MSTSTRVTRSKGESDGLSLPTRMRPTRIETISGRNGGTALNTTFNASRDQQQQMLTQTPRLPTQSPQANSVRRTETAALMLPPGPHRPLTPRMPLPTSPASSSKPSWSSDPLFKEDKYSSTSEEAPKTVQYQPPSFKLTRPMAHLTMNERIQVHHNYISAVSSLEHKRDLINRLK